MRDFREQNFYELLDVHPQASQQELDKAYQRARRIFNPDSVATYALFQPDELNLLRRRIEEAFRTLSDPERRAAYDQELARLDEGLGPAPIEQVADVDESEAADAPAEGAAPAAAPSEDDAPAVEQSAPDAEGAGEPGEPDEGEPETPESGRAPESEATAEALTTAGAAPDAEPAGDAPEAATEEGSTETPVEAETPDAQLEDSDEAACECPAGDGPPQMPVVDDETEVTGALLLQARLAKGLSLDDYVQVTKISIYYLRNIEEENFSDLPATVYTRGYLRQMAQLLGLDPQRVSSSYLERKARLEAEEGK